MAVSSDGSCQPRLLTTPELITWLNAYLGDQLVASALIDEGPRTLRRSDPGALGAVAATLAQLIRIESDAAIRATATAYTDPYLCSLDAIHLATAELLMSAGQTDHHLRHLRQATTRRYPQRWTSRHHTRMPHRRLTSFAR